MTQTHGRSESEGSDVEYTAVRTKHGTINVRVFYPKSGEDKKVKGERGALVYMHGGTCRGIHTAAHY